MAVSKVDRIAGGASVSIPVSLTTSTGATTTEGILLGASSVATLNNQKWSPSLHFQGSQWVAGGVNAAQTQDVKIELVPLQQASAYLSSQLYFRGGYADGTYVNSFFMDFDAAAFKIGTSATFGYQSISLQGATTPITLQSLNNAQWIQGQVSEQLTIAAAATTDTTANLLPADAIIEAVVVRVTTIIPTAATFTVGDATTPARFATGVAVAANTTKVGIDHWSGAVSTLAAGPSQAAAAKIRITPNLTPGAATGVVRITVFYRQFVGPTT